MVEAGGGVSAGGGGAQVTRTRQRLPDPAAGDRVCHIVPGLLGQGRNWRTIASHLARECSTAEERWTVVLVDLRFHGRSGRVREMQLQQRALAPLRQPHLPKAAALRPLTRARRGTRHVRPRAPFDS